MGEAAGPCEQLALWEQSPSPKPEGSPAVPRECQLRVPGSDTESLLCKIFVEPLPLEGRGFSAYGQGPSLSPFHS